MSIISKKICIIGESGVNPNGLIHRSMDYRFGEHYLSTMGVTISRKLLILPGVNPLHTLKLQLVIWNVTGNTKYQAIAPSYLRGSSGAVIFVDLSRQETIERLPEHIQVFLSVNPKGFIIIALNQSDLTAQENLEKLIQLQDLKQLSETYPTSVKTSSSVDEIFQHVAYTIVESCENELPLLHQSFLEIEDSSD